MTERDPRQPVEFEPVAIRPRRARFDPLIVGVVVAALALTTAVLKPWDVGADPATADGPNPSAPAASPAVGVEPSPPSPPAVAVVAVPALAWADIAGIIRPRDAWGIRAIVRTAGRTSTGMRTTYDERWIPMSATDATAARAVAQIGERAIVALGITSPSGETPLDVRIWRRTTRGSLRWLDARPIGRLPAEGGLIFAPPTTDAGSPAWGAGEYRIDVLTGGGAIQRFTLDIPDRYENVRPGSLDPVGASELVAASQVDPTSVPVGPFATIDRVGLALESVEGQPLDEAAAWLDTEAGSGRIPQDRVAVAYLPRATGLGVRLPDGSRIRSAALTRLSPGPFGGSSPRVGGGIIDRRDNDPWIVFAARSGEAWDPGTYRIELTWSDGEAVLDGTWHIELRPGRTTGPPPLLALTRAWARHAGASGLVVGRAEPLEGGPRSSAIRLLRFASEGLAGDQDAATTLCGGTIVDGAPEAFGFAYPSDDPLRIRWLRVDGVGSPAWQMPTVQATDVVAGLTLVAPTEGASFSPGIYRVGVQDRNGERVLTLCVGGASAAGG